MSQVAQTLEAVAPLTIGGGPVKMSVRNVSVFYGDNNALRDVLGRYPEERGHRADRPFRLRQVDLHQVSQPHERHD